MNEKYGILDTSNHYSQILMGCSKVDITPLHKVELAGFAHRTGVFDYVHHPLYVRTVVIQQEKTHKQGSTTCLFVSADLLFWGNKQVKQLQKKIHELFDIPYEAIILHATHTHSAPQTSEDQHESLGLPNADYLLYLEFKLIESIELAYKNIEAVNLFYGLAECNIGIHRRVVQNGKVIMAPNREGITDPTVTTIAAKSKDGMYKIVFVHYTCHPTTSGNKMISSEFCGVAMEEIEKKLGFNDNQISMYLQGFCGNIRPALISNDQFYRGGEKEIEALGVKLADKVIGILEKELYPVKQERLTVKSITFNTPLQTLLTIDELKRLADYNPNQASSSTAEGILKSLEADPFVLKQWSSMLLNHPEKRSYIPQCSINVLSIGEQCNWVMVNAEMALEYANVLKKMCKGIVLPIGYCNGSIGYVSTAAQIEEGGYEAHDFSYYFGLPAPYAIEIEQLIVEHFEMLLKE